MKEPLDVRLDEAGVMRLLLQRSSDNHWRCEMKVAGHAKPVVSIQRTAEEALRTATDEALQLAR